MSERTRSIARPTEKLATVGLRNRRRSSALDLPFEPGSFDGAYMMHVGMNIEDKRALFGEVRRVLKRGAAFGIYDVVLTGKDEPSYPLPCAFTPEINFTVGAEDYRQGLRAAGFEIEKERDRLEVARTFLRQEMARAAKSDGPPPLGVHILLKDAPRIFANVVSQFEKGVLAPIELFCRAR